DVSEERLRRELAAGRIVIVAGFQGITSDNDITTLGRGGSDTTAVALAAALKADVCEIYTDVDGVYTADPRVVPKARRLRDISYGEMLEMASLGAVVLQPRAVEFAAHHRVPLCVRSSFVDGPGTWVREEKEMEKDMVVVGEGGKRDGEGYGRRGSRPRPQRGQDRPGGRARPSRRGAPDFLRP